MEIGLRGLVGGLIGAQAPSKAQPQAPAEKAQPSPLEAVSLRLGESSFPLPGDGKVLGLGRHPDNGVVYQDLNVSRHHAQVCLKDGVLWIQDVGSRGGTFVNDKALKPGKWVPIGLEDQVRLASQALQFEAPESRDAVSLSLPAETRYEVRSGANAPVDLGTQPLSVGRGDNAVPIDDPQGSVSRHHALVMLDNGVPYIRDESSLNGTAINGQPLAVSSWAAVAPGAEVVLGKSSKLTFQPKLTMPDGREALVTPLPNGKVRVDKVDMQVKAEEIAGLNLLDREAFGKCASVDQLAIGKSYISFGNGTIRPLTYYGTDPRGRHRLGHSDEYSPAELARYLDSQARYLREQQEARSRRLSGREQEAEKLRESQVQKLGLQELLNDPPALATKLYSSGALLAFDGHDLWSKEVQNLVTGMKRQQLESQPGTKERGLVEVQLEEWLAAKRGEIVLYRGVRDAFNPQDPGKFYADSFGTALHTYAMGSDAHQSDVVALRVPATDAFRMKIDVGVLPGLNAYCSVVKVTPEELDYPAAPKLVVSSANPAQGWMFQSYGELAVLEQDQARDRFNQLEKHILGKSWASPAG